ncbi:hypothetical protein [Helicobacter sp. UBA3407]|uniref:hypothetical protein n=1 Tax=Helicobacter TaxID=209 RepID=UPI00261BDB1E|nr:hypothetical protein [Helicobacter sp. UBA3407]
MKKVLMSVLAIGALLAGCGGDLEFKNISAENGLNLEVKMRKEDDGWLTIISKNGDKVNIKNIVINKGEGKCGGQNDFIEKYGSYYEFSSEKMEVVFERYPELIKQRVLPTKDKKFVKIVYPLLVDKSEDMQYYNNLVEEAQKVYSYVDRDHIIEPPLNELSFIVKCSIDEIQEVTITTDKGKASYTAKR